jgi:hypothetical protein
MADETTEIQGNVVESHPGAEHNRLLLEWQAPEFIRHAKSKNGMWQRAS